MEENTQSESNLQIEKSDYSGFWEGIYYLSFFIFFNLFIFPNVPKQFALDHKFYVAGILYGLAGCVAGILVYRMIKYQPVWLKLGILVILYGFVLYQLVTHVENFTVAR